MPERLRVAAVACPAPVGALEDNLAAVADWTAAAADDHADLVLFPELSLTGYATNGPAAAPLGPSHAACRHLNELAAASGIAIAAGMAWQDEPAGPRYLAHGLWLPDGKLHIYRKTHLGQREQRDYAAGGELPVFSLPKATVGLQLCLEQHFPDITQTLALKGAQLILCPHATTDWARPSAGKAGTSR